jgi:protein-disulfide isomerase
MGILKFFKSHGVAIVVSFLSIVVLFFATSKPQAQGGMSNPFRDISRQTGMSRGSESASVSLIQYSDFLCPSCSVFSTQFMPKIDETYIQHNNVQFEFRPMAFIAAGSTTAGMGAYCAIDQNKFWDYHDAIYAFTSRRIYQDGLDPTKDVILTADIVKALARQAELDSGSFDSCLDSNKYLGAIKTATSTANSYGVTSTPYILVNGQQFKGSFSYEAIDALIKASL